MIDILELFPDKNNTSETIKKLNKDLFFFNNKVYSKKKLLLENILECKYLKNDILLIYYKKRVKSDRTDLLYALYDVKKEKIIAGDYRSVLENKNSLELIREGKHDNYFLDTNILYKGDRLGFRCINNNLIYDVSADKIINKFGKEVLDINKVKEAIKEKYNRYKIITSLSFNSDNYLVKVLYYYHTTKEILLKVIIDKSEEVVYKHSLDINFK